MSVLPRIAHLFRRRQRRATRPFGSEPVLDVGCPPGAHRRLLDAHAHMNVMAFSGTVSLLIATFRLGHRARKSRPMEDHGSRGYQPREHIDPEAAFDDAGVAFG